MPSPRFFPLQELFNNIIGDIAQALATRTGENPSRQPVRTQIAVRMIMQFLPRDAIEAMLAGHCVMFHELMLDSARSTLTGESDELRRATRASIVAMDRCFASNLRLLERYQRRPAQAELTAPATAGTPVASRPPEPAAVPTTEPPGRTTQAQAPATVPYFDADGPFAPSPEDMAALLANPEALAALESGDAAGFARALGIESPSEEYLAAAAQPGSPFDCAAWGGKTGPAVIEAGEGKSEPAPEKTLVPAGD